MRAVAHARSVFLDSNLMLEIGCHLFEFANGTLNVLQIPRFSFELATLGGIQTAWLDLQTWSNLLHQEACQFFSLGVPNLR